jgi:hypothetical protein
MSPEMIAQMAAQIATMMAGQMAPQPAKKQKKKKRARSATSPGAYVKPRRKPKGTDNIRPSKRPRR